MKREERRLSLPEAADALGISEITARRWIKSGKLRASQPGRNYQIPESAVEELLEPDRPKETPPQPSDSGETGEAARLAENIPIPGNLDSETVVDVVKEAVLAERRRNKQMVNRCLVSGQRQIIYSTVEQELEHRLKEYVGEDFFGTFMYGGLRNSARRIAALEEENTRLREELAAKEHA